LTLNVFDRLVDKDFMQIESQIFLPVLAKENVRTYLQMFYSAKLALQITRNQNFFKEFGTVILIY